MEYKTESIFSSVEQLQAYMMLGIALPQLRIWCKVSLEDWDALCDATIGDETKLMSAQYYGVEVDGFVYVVVGRSEVVNGIPTGNWKGNLSLEVQNAWTAKFGAESFALEVPVSTTTETTETI